MTSASKACLLALISVALLLCDVEAEKARKGVRPKVGPDPYIGKSMHEASRPKEKVFNVLKFGAKPDGRSDNAEAFMQTWQAACHNPGLTRMVVPYGVFITGPVLFHGPCSNTAPIIFQLTGTIRATVDISEYADGEWISFDDVHGLKIYGTGTVDGKGSAVWSLNDCDKNSNCVMLPPNLKFNKVTNVVVFGITSLNSKGFHITIINSVGVRFRKLNIFAPEDSPNTDGIHISRSSVVKIAKSTIATGDDCVSMIQGCVNVTVNKVKCGPGHGISIGSLGKYDDEEDVKNIMVINTTLANTDNGIRIKTWPDCPPSKATGFLFKNIIMDNVKNPIIIDQEYQCDDDGCTEPPSKVQISNVRFQDIRGTSSSRVAVTLKCSKKFPCENVKFNDVNIKHISGGPAFSECSNIKPSFQGKQFPLLCQPQSAVDDILKFFKLKPF